MPSLFQCSSLPNASTSTHNCSSCTGNSATLSKTRGQSEPIFRFSHLLLLVCFVSQVPPFPLTIFPGTQPFSQPFLKQKQENKTNNQSNKNRKSPLGVEQGYPSGSSQNKFLLASLKKEKNPSLIPWSFSKALGFKFPILPSLNATCSCRYYYFVVLLSSSLLHPFSSTLSIP